MFANVCVNALRLNEVQMFLNNKKDYLNTLQGINTMFLSIAFDTLLYIENYVKTNNKINTLPICFNYVHLQWVRIYNAF